MSFYGLVLKRGRWEDLAHILLAAIAMALKADVAPGVLCQLFGLSAGLLRPMQTARR